MSSQYGALVLWGRILRLSLWPTAMADVLAGFALAGSEEWTTGSLLLLFGASTGIYHGAMALNDWADSDDDAENRPERPIPAGLVRRETVLIVACSMVLGGVLLAFIADPRLGFWMLGIASFAVGYDLWLRGPFLGPFTLGICRGMHMAAPLVLITGSPAGPMWFLLVGYGIYVFSLSRLARLEELSEEELGRKPFFLLLGQAAAFTAPMLFSIFSGESNRPWLVMILACCGGFALVRRALGDRHWTPLRVQAAVGTALRLLLIYAAATALSGQGSWAFVAAVFILAGYPVAHRLRRVFPPT